MVYLKLVLNDKRLKEDNIYPIVLRVTCNRKNTSLSTGMRVKLVDWDKHSNKVKRTNQNFDVINQKLMEFYLKVQRAVIKLDDNSNFTFENLKESLEDKPKANLQTLPFKTYGEQLVQELLDVKRTGNAIVYRTAINRLIAFTDNPRLKFTEIDYSLLDKFSRNLTMGGAKPNTIGNYLRSIRAIYNKAIKAKLVERSFYPFAEMPIKTERTSKRAITIDDLSSFSKLKIAQGTEKWHARNYFLLSLALIGASFTDLAYLTPQNIRNGRLVYRRRKTGKELSIKLQPFTEKLIGYYTGSNSRYLLPIVPSGVEEDTLRAKALITQWIKTTNKWLRKIVKDCKLECDVTTYVARHSWATTAKRLGYSIEVIAEAMGHEHGNRITNIYLDSFDQSLIDEVNEKVIKSVTF